MTAITTASESVCVPVTTTFDDAAMDELVFGNLLNGRAFLTIGEQILFEREQQFYITRIDNEQQSYTTADYQQLPQGAPYQLIDGKLAFMASPLYKHQDTIGNLSDLIRPYVKKNKLGKVQFAPLDVYFDEANVFQPDLLFISNERKGIIKKFIHGAPDLIVEVLSSNKNHDLGKKKTVYGQYNVLEYWAIDYEKESLDLYLNKEAVLELDRSYQGDEAVRSTVLPDFSFTLSEIFEEEEVEE
ncbi:MAG: Uma2 family endonuclease [Bacteroidota bacterium]